MLSNFTLSMPLVLVKSAPVEGQAPTKPIDPDVDLAEAKADLAEALLNNPNSPEIAELAAKVAQKHAALHGSPAPAPNDDQAKAAAKVDELVSGEGHPLVVKAAQTLQQMGYFDGLDGLTALRAVVELARQPVMQGDDELIKSTVLKMITVPAYTRTDGVHVPEHRKMVHVNPNRSREDVLAGQGSHSQREAHARLSRMPHWNTLHPDHQYAHILSHATAIQNRRSASAALSGWRSRAREGRDPTPAQWAAFDQLPEHAQMAEIDAVLERQPDLTHLSRGGRYSVTLSAPAPTVESVANEHVNAPPAEPLPQPETDAVRAAMTAVPVPPGVAHWSNSPTNEGCRRRIRQLQDMAAAGDLDGVTNFSTSRTRANYALVDDYRSALLAAAHDARQPAQQPPQAATGAIPAPPAITGANPNNTALLAAQRKVQALYAAAQSADPVPAILAIPTSRGNGYMNRADDYKTALLRHFGYDHAGQATREQEHAPPEPVAEPAPAAEAPSRLQTVEPNPAVPPDRDPTVAAIRTDRPNAELGFVPRPNIALVGWRVERGGARHMNSNLQIPWPDARYADLANRYLSQPAEAQRTARQFMVENHNHLAPMNPFFIESVQRVLAERGQSNREREAREAQEREQRQRAAMAATRETSRRFLDALQELPSTLKPRAEVGANISVYDGDFAKAGENLGNLSAEAMKELAARMVADYGQGVRFKVSVSSFSDSVSVYFQGSDRTEIIRRFKRDENGKLYVYHSLFTAGSRGQGAGKALFRCSLGVYKALGISKVEVFANIDVGGYAWAKYGFKIASHEWERVAGRARRKLEILGLQPGAVKRLNEILNDRKPEAIFMLSDFKVGERAVGKELLLGSKWHGTLDLDNKSQYRRCIGYISQGRG